MATASSERRSKQRLNKIDEVAAGVLKERRGDWSHAHGLATKIYSAFLQALKLRLKRRSRETPSPECLPRTVLADRSAPAENPSAPAPAPRLPHLPAKSP